MDRRAPGEPPLAKNAAPHPSQHTNLTADPGAYAAGEYARELLLRLHTDPDFNASFGVYWATLPQQLFRAELFSSRHREMLQSPLLVGGAPGGLQGLRPPLGPLL